MQQENIFKSIEITYICVHKCCGLNYGPQKDTVKSQHLVPMNMTSFVLTVNFICQLHWITRLDVWLNIILDVSERVFLDECII